MITEEQIIDVLQHYEDPELGVDVWTLGLIYRIELDDEYVKIVLTFTSPMCPYGPQMVDELTQKIKEKGVEKVEIEVTFEPAWKPSEELRDMLGV
ncbi:metal-sulfur cluster assembly factor [Candidatus Woesearchaeota archaeon]|nr:metal-sulfur cluster assembly factor [Candidatus Woesearchaeota archaeon]